MISVIVIIVSSSFVVLSVIAMLNDEPIHGVDVLRNTLADFGRTPQVEAVIAVPVIVETVPVPVETVPAEAIPAETTATETVPAETIVTETVPVETTPPETAPTTIYQPQQVQLPPIIPAYPPRQEPELLAYSPFSVFSFYIPENAPLYEYFWYHNPHLYAETVVWKVNAHLHLPFYSYIKVNYNPVPLLVNTFYRLPPGFSPYPLVPVNHAYCFLRATPETVAAFRVLQEAAREAGLDLSVTSAFRTAGRQGELFSAQGYRDGAVARPYHSEHQTGRALDLWGPDGLLDARGPSPTGIWVAQNAHLYGFIVRYRAETIDITGYIHEPWHITYVGPEIAMYMYENRILSLEEFVGRNPGRQ